MEDYGGVMPDSYEELLKLKGIGSYTAGAVSSIAYGLSLIHIAAGIDQRCAWILPWYWWSESDIVQHIYEYVRQSCGSICNDPFVTDGICQPGLGQYGRMDRDAVVRGAAASEVYAERRVRCV